MHRLTALLGTPLRLIGSGFGSGERLIAAWNLVFVGLSAISRPQKPAAEHTKQRSRLGEAFVVNPLRVV